MVGGWGHKLVHPVKRFGVAVHIQMCVTITVEGIPLKLLAVEGIPLRGLKLLLLLLVVLVVLVPVLLVLVVVVVTTIDLQ